MTAELNLIASELADEEIRHLRTAPSMLDTLQAAPRMYYSNVLAYLRRVADSSGTGRECRLTLTSYLPELFVVASFMAQHNWNIMSQLLVLPAWNTMKMQRKVVRTLYGPDRLLVDIDHSISLLLKDHIQDDVILSMDATSLSPRIGHANGKVTGITIDVMYNGESIERLAEQYGQYAYTAMIAILLQTVSTEAKPLPIALIPVTKMSFTKEAIHTIRNLRQEISKNVRVIGEAYDGDVAQLIDQWASLATLTIADVPFLVDLVFFDWLHLCKNNRSCPPTPMISQCT